MTSQRLVQDFARWLWNYDWNARGDFEAVPGDSERIPDSYLDEAAVFLVGELGQQLQHGEMVHMFGDEKAAAIITDREKLRDENIALRDEIAERDKLGNAWALVHAWEQFVERSPEHESSHYWATKEHAAGLRQALGEEPS